MQLHGPPGGDGLGARIGVEGADLVSWRTVNGSASYLSHNDTRTLFGLGERRKVDLVEVRWLDGTRQTIRDVGVDSLLVVRRDGYRLLPLRSDPDAWD